MNRKLLNIYKIRRKNRTRQKIGKGTAERPRLSVFRSARHIHAQLINDEKGETLAFASSLEMDAKKSKTERAQAVGQLIAERACSAGIEQALFDRGASQYHGRTQALAEAAKKEGLKL